MANPPKSIEIADIATIETAELIVESCGADDGVHDIDEESFIIMRSNDLAERTVTTAEDDNTDVHVNCPLSAVSCVINAVVY